MLLLVLVAAAAGGAIAALLLRPPRAKGRGIAACPGRRGLWGRAAPARRRLCAGLAAARLRPVVVFFYGGAWSSGRREDYAFVGRALAAQGFVVVVPDYRLVPEVRFPTFLDDSAAAVQWARENGAAFGGDGERITLVGHSAGAYNAAMLALDPRWLGPDRAAVRGFVALAGPFDFLPLDDPATIAAFGAGRDRQRRSLFLT